MTLYVIFWCVQVTLVTGQENSQDYQYDEVDVDSLAKGGIHSPLIRIIV